MSHDAILVMSIIYGFIGVLTASIQVDKKRSDSAVIYGVAALAHPSAMGARQGR